MCTRPFTADGCHAQPCERAIEGAREAFLLRCRWQGVVRWELWLAGSTQVVCNWLQSLVELSFDDRPYVLIALMDSAKGEAASGWNFEGESTDAARRGGRRFRLPNGSGTAGLLRRSCAGEVCDPLRTADQLPESW
jgi:hypothetical protein